jgi:hypothetical protein
MKKSNMVLVFLLAVTLLLTGCQASFFDPENALTAPGATGIYQGAQQALEEAVGSDIVLKYPLVENVNTAFCPKDLDGDNQQEILAFYRQITEGAATRVNLIRNTEEGWRSVQDLDPLGSDVVSMDFCDLNGDGKDEICIGWSVTNTQSHQMSVYEIVNGLLVQRALEAYTRHVFCDIDGDGVKELGLALLDTANTTSTITFYEMGEKEFSAIGFLPLDGSVLSYAKITAVAVTSKIQGVYLDAYKGSDSTITELIYMKDGKLYNPFAGNQDNVNIATLRHCTMTATDINKDGIVEVPFMEHLPGYNEQDTVLTHHLICWRYFNGNISDSVSTWWYNAEGGYYLAIDATWQGEISSVYDDAEQEYVFYHWNGDGLGARLFGIKQIPLAQWNGATDSYAVLQKDASSVWVAKVEQGNPLKITFNQLQSNFHLYISQS